MRFQKRVPVLPVVLALLCSISSLAQQTSPPPAGACATPEISTPSSEVNIFTEEQEEWLGDIMDQEIRREFHVIEDPDGFLQQLGERLVAQLPPTRLHYHFLIIDTPELNAFGIVGGRIYIHRTMIAFMQSEDELAALVGHEIGHVAAHQAAIDVSRWFRELGITKVGDRQDLMQKWNYFKDNSAKIRRRSSEKHGEQEQHSADRIGLYAMMRAGYDPASFITFADRSFETRGKTGGFWSDFFGATKPESKRLREIMRITGPMAASCITAAKSDKDRFSEWRQRVIASRRVMAKEDVPGLERKIALHPRLRDDLRLVRFSPDGNHLLAQDETSIFVLTRDPLANLFRIDALDAHPAQFTPDSRAIVFYDKELRVEKWDLETATRTSLRQIASPHPCLQSRLSPSGEVLACITGDFELQLFDVNAGTVFFSRKKFYELTAFDFFLMAVLDILEDQESGAVNLDLFNLKFSSDNRYFVASSRDSVFAYDLQGRSEIKLPGRMKQALSFNFTFVGNDKIAHYEFKSNHRKVIMTSFPAGEKLDEFDAQTGGTLDVPTKGNYLLARHGGPAPVLAIDLNTKKVVTGYKVEGYDIYDQWFAGETTGGEVAVAGMADKKPIAKLQLPDSSLEESTVSAFSGNGKWLAVSGKSRGALWNLATGERTFHTFNFDGVLLDHDQFIAKFPKRDKEPTRVYQFDPIGQNNKELYRLEEEDWNGPASALLQRLFRSRNRQLGELLIKVEPLDKKRPSTRQYVMTVSDVRTNRKLWEREVRREFPSLFYTHRGNTITMVIANYDNIKAEAKLDPALNRKLSAIEGRKGKEDSYLIRSFDALTGKDLGAVLVDTGNLSFKVRWAYTAGDTVIVGDSKHRTLVYSLKSNEQKGKVTGTPWTISSNGDVMLIEDANGAVDLYDTTTLHSMGHYTFPARIARADFSDDGQSMFVLTVDQSVYQFRRPGATRSAAGR